ncbi:hypothetical protein CW304_07550 [Bacillus sp. UFRGS-B20]|nr:hypothetical protein CW304_07550 [Bacillus sp. UFRGS-B20]
MLLACKHKVLHCLQRLHLKKAAILLAMFTRHMQIQLFFSFKSGSFAFFFHKSFFYQIGPYTGSNIL